jgi:hypothetical protein
MTIQDAVIPSASTEVADKVIPDVQNMSANSDVVEDYLAIKAGFLENYNTGIPVAESYLNHKGVVNKEAAVTQLSIDKVALDNTAISEEYEATIEENPEIFSETAPLIIGMQDENAATVTDSAKQFVDAVANPNLDEDVKASLINQVKLWESLQKTTKDIDFGDKLLDFGKSLLPLRDTINEAFLLGSVFDNEEEVRKMIFGFKSMSHEEQQAMFPDFSREILGEIGPLRGADLLTKFIDPNTGDELGDFANVWKIFDVVDIASMGGTMVLKANAFRKAFNIPKLLSRAESKDIAGESVAAAMVDPQAAKAMNIDPETAMSDSLAFDTSALDISYEANLSTESRTGIANFFQEADRTTAEIMSANTQLKDGLLNTVERATVEEATFAKLSAANHEFIQLVSKTENTSTFSYKVKNPDTGNLYDEQYTLDMTLDDVGQWNQDELGVLSEFIASPTVFAKGLTLLDVETAQRVDLQTAKIFSELNNLQKQAVAPLGNLLYPKNKKRLAGVEKALRTGDEWKHTDGPLAGSRGEVFDVDTLKSSLFNLDDEQVEVYYNTNRLYNNLWSLRNNSKREEMIAFGQKRVSMIGEEYSFGKAFDDAGSARSAVKGEKIAVNNIFDSVENSVINDISEAFLEKQYASGKTLVKLGDNYQVTGGRGKFSYALVNKESVTSLPANVLSRKRGYVPKAAKDGYWFVKEKGDATINGTVQANSTLKTLRYFDNRAEAEAFTAQRRVEAVESDNLTPQQAEAKYVALEDREQEILATATGSFSHGSGGLYTGVRAEDDILFGLNGEDGKRLNAYESLSNNIASVSRLVPINQWRLGLEQRWLNTANKMLDSRVDSFGEIPDSASSTRKGEFLNVMAKQIRDWQGFPSRNEQIYQSINQRMYEWSLQKEGLGRTAIKGITGWARDKDPVSAARSAAFHSLLGWYNPAQLFVQAQGMAVAVSINLGKNLTKTLRDTSALTILGQAPITQGTKRFTAAAKAAGSSAEDLIELHRLWKKTGYEESILQTADHAAAMRGHGIAMDAISRAADNGLFFYRHGEFLNRRMAFTTAVDEFKTLPKNAGKFIDDDDLKGIIDRSNNLLLNITKANRASWQKGLSSIPTQFFQVSAKALESVMGANANFTRAERGRILAGQVALYGTAGVPMATLGITYAMEYLGVTQQDLDDNPIAAKAINDGFWGATTLGIFGVDAEVAKRGSLVRGVTEFVDNWMYSESTMASALSGAFGSTQTRFWDEFSTQMAPMTLGAHPTDALTMIKIPLMPVLETISTWRNVEKAIFMQTTGLIIDKKNNIVIEKDFSVMESIAKAIGFQLTAESQIYTLTERTKHVADTNMRIADAVIERMTQVANRGSLGILTDAYKNETSETYALMFGAVDPARQKDIMKSVKARIRRDSKETRAINQYIKKVYGSVTSGLSLMADGILGTSLVTINPPKDKE